jgi:hypothetical protein
VGAEYQLREYRIQPGAMKQWVKEWEQGVRPLREKLGFRVVGAWTIEDENRFVWILSWEGIGSFQEADRAYYDSPERAAIAPDPARLIVSSEHRMMRTVLPSS